MKNSSVVTQDGTQIAISKYTIQPAKGTIIVASATGVPRRLYKHFAKAASSHGYNVYTLDYRGVGDSAPKSLKGYKMDYLDWARQDLYALIELASKDGLPLFYVGHSYGGHALGLLDNADKLQAAYLFGTGAGWSGWMPRLERLKVEFLWGVLAPAIVRIKGYLAWHFLGMGEDLPYGVYEQWKRWCRYPHYFFDDPNMQGIREEFTRYSGKIVAVNASDDLWAQPRSRDAFMSAYTSASIETIDVEPMQYNLKSIGHMGYFFKHAQNLWIPVFELFNHYENSLEKPD